jgi:hypothetical protein
VPLLAKPWPLRTPMATALPPDRPMRVVRGPAAEPGPSPSLDPPVGLPPRQARPADRAGAVMAGLPAPVGTRCSRPTLLVPASRSDTAIGLAPSGLGRRLASPGSRRIRRRDRSGMRDAPPGGSRSDRALPISSRSNRTSVVASRRSMARAPTARGPTHTVSGRIRRRPDEVEDGFAIVSAVSRRSDLVVPVVRVAGQDGHRLGAGRDSEMG